MATSPNRRTSLRVGWRFRVRIVGLDSVATLRTGNLSETGVYFDADSLPGSVGAVERIELQTEDRGLRVDTLAVLVRVVTAQDLGGQPKVAGLGFEFFPKDEATRSKLKTLAGDARRKTMPDPSRRTTAENVGDAIPPAGPAADEFVVETPWPVEKGTTLALTVGDGPVETMRGAAISSRRRSKTKTFRTTVAVYETTDGTRKNDNNDGKRKAAENLFPESTVLSGDLGRVGIPALLGFVAGEGLSGVLKIMDVNTGGLDAAGRIWIRDGTPVDAETDNVPVGRESLKALFARSVGRFVFDVSAVTRKSQFSGTTTFILMDIATELDEENRS